MRKIILFNPSNIKCKISEMKFVEYATRSVKSTESIVNSSLQINVIRMTQNVKQSEQLNGFGK